MVPDQAGDTGDEDRAQQPSCDDLHPKIKSQTRASNCNRASGEGALALRSFVGPPVVFLMEIHERQEYVERIQKWMKPVEMVGGRRRRILGPRKTHHARP